MATVTLPITGSIDWGGTAGVTTVEGGRRPPRPWVEVVSYCGRGRRIRTRVLRRIVRTFPEFSGSDALVRVTLNRAMFADVMRRYGAVLYTEWVARVLASLPAPQ